jgi:hypothetical protein
LVLILPQLVLLFFPTVVLVPPTALVRPLLLPTRLPMFLIPPRLVLKVRNNKILTMTFNFAYDLQATQLHAMPGIKDNETFLSTLLILSNGCNTAISNPNEFAKQLEWYM